MNNRENKIDVKLESPEIQIGLESAEIQVEFSGGVPGLSAYEVWLQQGNIGTVQDFLDSLRGEVTNTYIHEQIFSTREWYIYHHLNMYPSVTIVDTGGNVIIGEVQYLNNDLLVIRFTYEFSGTAYLN